MHASALGDADHSEAADEPLEAQVMTDVLTDPRSQPSARRAQTRARLMTAAVNVFAERGIIGASVEEICESAGFTRGAFYSNFSGKDDLVVALLRHEMDTQYSAAQQAIATMKAAAGPDQSALSLVSTALAAYEEAGRAGPEWVLTQQELLLHAARVPEIRAAYLVFSAECLKQVSTLLRGAIAHVGLEFTIPFEDAITLLTATHDQMLMASLLSGDQPDSHPIRVLLLAITRPVSGADPGATS
jgi:AcrR family transcriptional regulator